MSEPELQEDPRRPWPRRMARPLLWVLLAVVLLVAALVVLYRSPWAAERVRLLVEARMSEYLDRDVDVGRVEYGLRPGSFVLYDLVIPSPDPDDPPFAVVPRTEVRFALSGFTRLTLDVVRVEVERPEVHVLFHADGTNNLPELQRPRREGPGRVEVVIGHLVVEGGTLHFDQRAMPLEIDAQAVRAFVEGAGEAPGGGDRFLAVAAAQEVRIVLPDARPWHGALAARGSFVPGRVDVTGGWARGPGLAARFEGFYGWNEEQRHGIVEVEAAGDAELARRLGYVEEAIDGPFGFEGRVTIDERDISYAGNVTSERLEYGPRAFTGVLAEIAGDADALVVDVDRAGHAGGTVAGVVRVDLSGADPDAGRAVEIDGDFDDLAIEALLADLDLETDLLSRLTGRASGDLAYRFSTAAPLAGSGEATVRVAAVRGATEDLPLSGRAELAIEDGVLSSDDVDLAAPGQRLAASGRWDLEERAGRFDFRLATEDPGRLLRALPPIEVSDPPPGWFPTAGRGTVEGTVAVAGEEVELEATVDLTGVVTPTLELARLRAPVELRDGVLVLTDLLAAGPEQRLTASGRWDLDAERGRFDFQLATGDAGDLLRTVPAIEIGDPPPDWFPLEGSGTAAGHLEIAGGEVAVVADVELRDVVTPRLELTRLAAPVEYRNGVVSTSGLVAVGPGQRLTASGRYDVAGERGSFELALVSEDLGEIAALVPREPGAPPPPWLPTAGRGTVEGTLSVAPGPELTGRAVFDLAAVDTPSGRWDTLAGSLRLTPGAIRDLRLEATADGGALVAAGDVPFPLDAGDLELSVSVVDFPVERLAGLVPQIPETTGRVTARIDAVGAFDRLQGQATVELG
ncbi:MAG TPA: hypothetical protein VHM02_02260, partial [Thermoanaerobaculia bacterium]|nr:hypothetical protein [Thermoanaerobaculia bacterium]